MDKIHCTLCNSKLKDNNSYKRHLKIHLKDTNTKLNAITELDKLQKNKIRIFECEYCDKQFVCDQNLKKHINNSCKNNLELVCFNKIKKLLKNVENLEYRKQLGVLLDLPPTTLNCTNYNSGNTITNSKDVKFNNNNFNINVNNYGSETLDSIKTDGTELSKILLETHKLSCEKDNKDKRALEIANAFYNAKIDHESVQRDQRKIWKQEQKECENRSIEISKTILEYVEDILLDFFQKIHIDEDHPENHNIYIPNMRSDKDFFIMKEQWKKIGTIQMFQKNTQTYYGYLLNAIDFLIENTTNQNIKQRYVEGKKKITDLYDNIENKTRLEKSLAKKFFDTIYQNKSLLKKTYDSTKDQGVK